MTSSPLERSVTSLAIATNATAEDSGGGVTCAKISFFGLAWAKAGALASESIPAAPAACRMRRRVAEAVIVTGVLPDVVFSAFRHYSRRVLAPPGNRSGTAETRAQRESAMGEWGARMSVIWLVVAVFVASYLVAG